MAWWVKYIGLPFVSQGRGPRGYDCWGLVRLVYEKEFGILLPSWAAKDWAENELTAATRMQEALPSFRKLETPEPQALILFDSPIQVFHIGLLVSPDRMLHTTLGRDSCVQEWASMRHYLKGFFVPCSESSPKLTP